MYSTPAYLVDQKSIVLLVDTELNTTYRWSPVFSKRLTLNKGVDNVFNFQFLNQEQKPVDISRFNFTFRLIDSEGENLLLAVPLEIVNARTGTARAIVTSQETTQLPAQPASWSIERGSASQITAVTVTESQRGRDYTSAPTVTAQGTGTGAQLRATITGAVGNVTILDAGAGFTAEPTVTFVGGGGTGANGRAVLSYGVTGVEILNVGDGYDPGNANIVAFSAGIGNDTAQGTAVFAGNSVIAVNISNPGTYDAPPSVTFAASSAGNSFNAQAQAILSGRVASIAMANFGRGYTGAPAITITGGGGHRTAQAVCNLTNRVSQVTVLAGGQDYFGEPIITFTGGGVTDANLQAQGRATVGGDSLYTAGYVDDAASARGDVDIVDSVYPRFTESRFVTIPRTNTGNVANIDGVNRPVAWTSLIQGNGSPLGTFQVDYANYTGVVQIQGSWQPESEVAPGMVPDWYQIGNLYYYDNKYGKEHYNVEGYHPYIRVNFAIAPVQTNLVYYSNVAANIYGNTVTKILYRA